MPNRCEPITRLPLTEPGVRLPREQSHKNEAELLRSLQDDVPVLRHLRASEITSDYEVIDKRLWLLFLLQEKTQESLAFSANKTRPRAGTVDPYAEDLSDVRHQVGQVQGRILIAISGAASPLDGTQDSPQASSTATIRRRVKRGLSNGQLLIPYLPVARPLMVGQLPTTLPQGPSIVISARVNALDPECAQLAAVRLEDAKGSGANFQFSPTKQVRLARIGAFQRVAPGTRLQIAMDSRTRIRMEVVAALDWASGHVVSFELRNFIDA